MAEDEENALAERASSRARLLRERAMSLPPESTQDVADVREGVAASAEIGLLVLQKVNAFDTKVQLMQKDLQHALLRLEQLEDPEKRATELLFEERRSQLGLNEEAARADLLLKKQRDEHRRKILTRIVAVVMTPPGLWGVWEWIQTLLH